MADDFFGTSMMLPSTPEYRAAGGLDMGTLLQQFQQQQQQDQAAQQQESQFADIIGARDTYDAQQELQARRQEAQQNFVSWPKFKELTVGTEPGRQYDGYLGVFEHQLEQMGYAPEQVQQFVAQFQQAMPRPAEDFGPLGNIWESLTGGYRSGERAGSAAVASVTGDRETLARLMAEQAGEQRPAPAQRFVEAIAPPADEPDTLAAAADRWLKAGFTEFPGLLNFAAEQVAQSWGPAIGAAAGGALGGLAFGPVGAVAGAAGGLLIPDLALDAGSTVLDGLAEEAQKRGIDPKNTAQVLALLNEPGVLEKIRDDGFKHGTPVAAVDAAATALTLGAGGVINRTVKAASAAKRAGELATAASLRRKAIGIGVGTELGDIGAGAFGEKLGQEFQGVDKPGDVFAEAAIQAVMGAAGLGFGYVGRGLRRRPATLPGAPPGVQQEEEDLPKFGAGGFVGPNLPPSGRPPSTPFYVTPTGVVIPTPEGVEGYQQYVQQLADEAERAITIGEPPAETADEVLQRELHAQATSRAPAEINIGPIGTPPPTFGVQELPAENVNVTTGNVVQGLLPAPGQLALRTQVKLATATAPEIQAYLEERGIAIGDDPELRAAVDTIADAPDQQLKLVAIAHVAQDLLAADHPQAEPLARELVKLSQQIQLRLTPKQREEIAVAQAQAMPKLSLELARDFVKTLEAANETPPEATAQSRRGLRAQFGETVPGPGSLAPQFPGRGLKRSRADVEGSQGRSSRGLRAGESAQGPVARGDAGGRATGSAAPAAATVESVVDERGRTISRVQGTRYGVEPEAAVSTKTAEQTKEEIRQKGASLRARERQLEALVTSKEQYEKTYPGRNWEEDVGRVIDMPAGEFDAPVDPNAPLDAYKPQPGAWAQLTGSAGDVMQYLGSVMQNPLSRLVAARIQELIRDGLVLPEITFDRTLNRQGRYRSQLMPDGTVTHQIFINPDRASLQTVLHEYVHAATMGAMLEPKTNRQRIARKKLEALHAYARDNLRHLRNDPTGYGLTDVYEFISEAMSSLAFQKELAKLKLPRSAQEVWTAFKDAVMQILGFKTSVLSETLKAGEELFSTEQFGVSGFDNLLAEMTINRPSVIEKNAAAQAAAQRAQGAALPKTAIAGLNNNQRTYVAYRKDPYDPNSSYTLYPVTPQEPRGVKNAGIKNLTRQQVEQHITAAGSTVLPPVSDVQPQPGTPRASSTQMFGFAPNGDLQVAAYEQKDGTWTYYESDTDIRTDPDATVHKGLTKTQAQRYLSAKNVQTTAPTPQVVNPNAVPPTAIGYKPPSAFAVTWQNVEAALMKLGAAQEKLGIPPGLRIDFAAVLRNTKVEQKIKEVARQYFEPARAAGEKIANDYNKTSEDIEQVLVHLHLIERSQHKIPQFQRGTLTGQALADKINQQNAHIKEGQDYLRDLNNPDFVDAVKRDLAPKMQALGNNNLDMAAQYGLLSRESVEAIKDAYDFYVPLQTDKERTSIGKAATGRATKGDLSFARMQEQAMKTIARGEQNRLRQMVMRLAQNSGIVNTATKENVATVGSTVEVRYNKETNSLDEGQNSHIFDENTITVYVNGNHVPLTITDDALLQALHPYKGAQRQTMITTLLGWAAAINHIVSIGKTALAPVFAPFNFMRDVGTAMINMPARVSRVKFLVELMKPETYASAAWNTMRDAFGADMQGQFGAAAKEGAFISQRAYIGMNLDEIANSTIAAFKPTAKQQLKKKGQTVYKVAMAWAQTMENLTRYAVYKAALETPGMSEAEAAVAAKTASVNFETRGLKNLSPYWIFANAKIQGLAGIYHAAERAGLGKASLVATGMIMLGLTAGMIGYRWSDKDKDGKSKYLKIPDYKKDSLVLFKENAPGIPMPQEIAPFYVLGNTIADMLWGGKKLGEATSRAVTATINNLWPGGVPQTEIAGHKSQPTDFLLRAVLPSQVLPVYDVRTNSTTFGSEVVAGLADKKARGMAQSDMGSANESTLAVNTAKSLYKATGGVIDAAPQQLRLLNNYFNPAAEGVAFWRDMVGGRDVKYEGDIVNPVVRKFTGKATIFYDQDQFDELLAKSKHAALQAKEAGIEQLSPEDQALAKSSNMLGRVDSDTKALFKNSKLLSKEQMQLRQDRKHELILDGIRRYNELRDRTARP